MKQPQKRQNHLIEKVKNVDTPMYFIGALFLICIITIVYYLFFRSDKNSENINEMEMPENRTMIENYNSKIQAYEKGKEKQETNLSLDFNKGFLADEDTIKEQKDVTQDKRFQELEAQIATTSSSSQPSGGTYRNSAPRNTYEKPATSEITPKKESRTAKTGGTHKVIPKEEKTHDFEADLPTVETKKLQEPSRRVGQKLTFEDLPETEQKRILLQTGQRTYQESTEIKAKIISTGEVKAGQTVRLMLQEKAILNFKVIPSGTTISGVVSFNQNRMNINFSTIRLKNEIIKVNLDLYAMDGLKGLPIGGENYTKESEDEGINEAISKTGRIGRIVGSVAKSVRREKEISVDLGRDISCILVNNSIEE